ncbi:FtsX-like permease family protein [Bifidobacterium sp. SMB2]|uniref:FtsX-like permease family protein n=1 Tax=Bifidobacterium saimiriisciurei TaxID=2661627 RepID=A0ABX0C7P8_9BIFI|nr:MULTISPECIES: ABC transporter permease [Bifidobacterium]NEG96166.1 FtsX-like permease family protein [Bifidobacterium sp. SMB2]NEH10756.1 FtsX-like permease family protein [Bifidobacterium saimiriisciurei]
MAAVPHITLGGLPLENLRRKPFRTTSLIVVVAILAAAFFGGSILALNLNKGLKSMEERLGADLMVVPSGSQGKAEALLTNGNPNTFYFTNDIGERVQGFDGVEQATEQTYIASLAAECCDEKVQIVGFNPETDFVIEPWIASQYDGTLGEGEVIVGSSINVSADNTIKLYNHVFPVKAQLARTATGLDSSVFISDGTVPDMVSYANKVTVRGSIPDEYADKAVSSVLVRLQPGYSAEQVAEEISKSDLKGVGFVYPGGVTSTTKTSLNTILAYVAVFLAVFWVLALIVLLAVFSSSVNERKKEFASLRIMGATRGMLTRIVLGESALIGLVGGVIGIASASLVVFPFSGAIGKELELPYLQVGVVPCLLLIVGSLAFAVVTGALASLASAFRLGRPEAYLTLREGE